MCVLLAAVLLVLCCAVCWVVNSLRVWRLVVRLCVQCPSTHCVHCAAHAAGHHSESDEAIMESVDSYGAAGVWTSRQTERPSACVLLVDRSSASSRVPTNNCYYCAPGTAT